MKELEELQVRLPCWGCQGVPGPGGAPSWARGLFQGLSWARHTADGGRLRVHSDPLGSVLVPALKLNQNLLCETALPKALGAFS